MKEKEKPTQTHLKKPNGTPKKRQAKTKSKSLRKDHREKKKRFSGVNEGGGKVTCPEG